MTRRSLHQAVEYNLLMSASQLELMPGENMVLSGNPHWWYFWKQVAAGVGVLALLFLLWKIDSGWASTAIRWIALVAFVAWLANTIFGF